jgi:hypothetical protein
VVDRGGWFIFGMPDTRKLGQNSFLCGGSLKCVWRCKPRLDFRKPSSDEMIRRRERGLILRNGYHCADAWKIH